jgi:hypothetical protein
MGLIIIPNILIFLLLVAITVFFVFRKTKNPINGYILSTFLIIGIIVAFTWDEILGRKYFYDICHNEGGIKIYSKVKLDASYYDEKGNPIYIDNKGNFLPGKLNGEYTINRVMKEGLKYGIKEIRVQIKRNDSREINSEYVKFIYFGGWFINNLGWKVKGFSCPSNKNIYSELFSKTFVTEK